MRRFRRAVLKHQLKKAGYNKVNRRVSGAYCKIREREVK